MKPNLAFLAASAGTLAMWFAALGALSIANRPREPDQGPETTELGPEPPAVVNLLTQHFRATTEAVPATLLDLASRRFLDIELVGGGKQVLRVRPDRPAELTDYEAQVLSHVASLAVDGVVPTGALTTGPADASRKWWHRFRDGVIADAQRRGYTQDRWTERMYLGLTAGGFVPAGLYAAAIDFDTDNMFTTVQDGVVVAVLFAGLVLIWTIANSKQQRDLPAGLAAAGRWLGVRAGLARNRQLATVPPSAVAVWERSLACAVAMGIAPAAAEGLPLGAEDDRVAWSDEGGRWRRVLVRYPRWRPGWGMSPLSAFFFAAVWGIPAFLVLISLSRIETPSSYDWLRTAEAIGVIVAGVVLLGSVALVVQAVADTRQTRDVTGTVVRLRRRSGQQSPFRENEEHRYFVALDDGRSPKIASFMVPRRIYDRLTQGERATLTITPRLRYVTDARSA